MLRSHRDIKRRKRRGFRTHNPWHRSCCCSLEANCGVLRCGGSPVEGAYCRGGIQVLGATFTRLSPVQDAPRFSDLLQAIDEADRELRRQATSKIEPDLD